MRKTIFGQLLFYILIFGALAALVSYLVLGVYFDNYYYKQQQNMLVKTTQEILSSYNTGGADAAYGLMDFYLSEHGISAQLVSPAGNMMHGAMKGMHGQGNALSQNNIDKIFIMTGGLMQGHNSGPWLAYLAEASDGSLLLARISYENMDTVLSIVKKFILAFGIFIAVFFIAFAFVFSRSMSRPLRELNSVASSMGRLDFSTKYNGARVDEIGQLGHTLNELTQKLENTISQLKGELSKEKTLEQMRTRFTAQVSHELQTPLAVIKGYAEALSDKLYSEEEAPEAYSILFNEAQKMSDLVSDLLDMSQIQAGAYVLRKAEVNLPEFLAKIVKRYQSLPRTKQFDVKLDMDDPSGINLLADPLRLEQAIGNVLNNAVKHVSEGGTIRISLRREAQRAVISVFNQGNGIAEGDLPHIFESYYQGKGSRKGSGLGLAITKHIVELHGGTISARNLDHGVVFEIAI